MLENYSSKLQYVPSLIHVARFVLKERNILSVSLSRIEKDEALGAVLLPMGWKEAYEKGELVIADEPIYLGNTQITIGYIFTSLTNVDFPDQGFSFALAIKRSKKLICYPLGPIKF